MFYIYGEIEKTKTIQKKLLVSECFTTWYQLREIENKLATGEKRVFSRQHRKTHSGEKSNDLVSVEGNGKETGNSGE